MARSLQMTGDGGARDEAPLAFLVAEARRGDEGAFAALVRLHQDRAYEVALRMTGNAQDAQDVVQEAFLHSWKGLPQFRQDAQFGTWLTRIVINCCHNLRRSARSTEVLPEQVFELAEPGADTLVVAEQRRAAVRGAVLELPVDQRAVLVLHTFVGCKHAEVAHILGITENTAKVRAHRARTTLTNRLRDWG